MTRGKRMSEEEKKEWHMTANHAVAMRGGYIGESRIRPSIVAWSIGKVLGKRHASFQVYYYGVPDAALKLRFGYE